MALPQVPAPDHEGWQLTLCASVTPHQPYWEHLHARAPGGLCWWVLGSEVQIWPLQHRLQCCAGWPWPPRQAALGPATSTGALQPGCWVWLLVAGCWDRSALLTCCPKPRWGHQKHTLQLPGWQRPCPSTCCTTTQDVGRR